MFIAKIIEMIREAEYFGTAGLEELAETRPVLDEKQTPL